MDAMDLESDTIVAEIRAAFDADVDEDQKAEMIWNIQQRLNGKLDLHMAVNDKLLNKREHGVFNEHTAYRAYLCMAKQARGAPR